MEPEGASTGSQSCIRQARDRAAVPPEGCQTEKVEEEGGGDQGPGVGAGQAGCLAEGDAQRDVEQRGRGRQ
jgi:hypothetical protein